MTVYKQPLNKELMQFLNFKNRPIIFKIVLPIILIIILTGGTLYYFTLKSISDFAEEYVQRDILNFSFEIFNTCDRNLTDLLYEGKADDEKSVAITKGLTLDSIETYARQKDIGILIHSEDTELLNTASIDKTLFDAALKKAGQVSSVEFNNDRHYIYLLSFEPWKWQILISGNPAKYAYIENKVQLSYVTSGIILFLAILLLIWSLDKAIRSPLQSIVESLHKGSAPDYKGTKEIEFLSNTICDMTSSLKNRVSELETKEKELKKANEFNKTIINSINDALYIIESDSFNIIATNQVFKDRINVPFEEIIGKTCYEVLYKTDRPCEQCHAKDVIQQSKSFTYEEVFYRNDGTAKYLEISISPIRDEAGNITHLVYVVRDITERRHLEEQFRQSQKLESIGILSGGIAHDFNNILTAIIGYGNLLQMKLDKDSPLNRYIEQILKSSERAANLVSSLLAFSRKQMINPVPVELNETIRKIGKLLRRLLEENIEVKISLKDDKLMVKADHIQIEQILLNLATNARDAMPKGGILSIETDCVEIDEDFMKIYNYGQPGHYAMVSVTDTGSGIDPKILQEIFDPFFTTKEVGKGTGLGLSMVYGTIKQHNGFINVYSEIGKGTTFKIYLPLIEMDVDVAKDAKISLKSNSGLEGNKTILIAEDEDIVRDLYSEALRNFGYKVLESGNGDEALQVFSEHKDDIDLVLTDVIMPMKNGKELIQDIQKIKPDIRVIFMSGYSQDLIDDKSLLEDKVYFISKPVSPADLLKMIREILDKPA